MRHAGPAVLALVLTACTTTTESAAVAKSDTQRELRELRTNQQQLERKLAQLDTRMSLLSEKIDNAVPRPPPELDVVHLVPQQPQVPADEAELDDYHPIGARDDGGDPVVIRMRGNQKSRPPRTQPPRPSGRDVKTLYEAARQLYQDGKFEAAARAFAELVREQPRHDLADNSTYWQGMCSFQLGEHAKAIELLQQVPVRYPQSSKVPYALLHIGRSYHALKDSVSARVFLTQVVEQYPDLDAATQARALLKSQP